MIRNFVQAISEYQSRRAELYLKHLTWQPMTDEDVDWVNNPTRVPNKNENSLYSWCKCN
jgi:hypothetical protein